MDALEAPSHSGFGGAVRMESGSGGRYEIARPMYQVPLMPRETLTTAGHRGQPSLDLAKNQQIPAGWWNAAVPKVPGYISFDNPIPHLAPVRGPRPQGINLL